MPFDAWHSIYDLFYTGELNVKNVWAGVGGVLQYVSILWILYEALRHAVVGVSWRLHRGTNDL